MDKTERINLAAGAQPIEELCSLPSVERENRIATFRRNILPLATKRHASVNGMTLDFEYSATLEQQLEELVTFERVCCSDIDWDLNRSQANVLSLGVSGIPSNSRFFADIESDCMNPQVSSGSGSARKLAQSIGLGTTAAAILCCVVPMPLAAVTGVAIAGPLARLENPLTIAAGSLAFSIAAWLWLKRRDARSSSCGC